LHNSEQQSLILDQFSKFEEDLWERFAIYQTLAGFIRNQSTDIYKNQLVYHLPFAKIFKKLFLVKS
jgi:hypothetical protein